MLSEKEARNVRVNHRLAYDIKCHLFLTNRTFTNCFSGPPSILMNNESIFYQCTAIVVVFLRLDLLRNTRMFVPRSV